MLGWDFVAWFQTLDIAHIVNLCIYMFIKELPNEVREAQQKKLEELKKQLEIHNTLIVERKIQLRDRKIKFFGTYLFLHFCNRCPIVYKNMQKVSFLEEEN